MEVQALTVVAQVGVRTAAMEVPVHIETQLEVRTTVVQQAQIPIVVHIMGRQVHMAIVHTAVVQRGQITIAIHIMGQQVHMAIVHTAVVQQGQITIATHIVEQQVQTLITALTETHLQIQPPITTYMPTQTQVITKTTTL